ncbi:MAG: hypothetical protein HY917_01785 [Candidatus Diapherotrites archaeon]|nr:hypothetical protein [Candidatus Diapherotrites archaeon]
MKPFRWMGRLRKKPDEKKPQKPEEQKTKKERHAEADRRAERVNHYAFHIEMGLGFTLDPLKDIRWFRALLQEIHQTPELEDWRKTGLENFFVLKARKRFEEIFPKKKAEPELNLFLEMVGLPHRRKVSE